MDKCDLTYVLQEQSGCCINHWGARAEAGRLREGSCSCLGELFLFLRFIYLWSLWVFFFFFHVRKVMCRCRNKVWRDEHITQQREHPIIMLMNYKRITLWVFIAALGPSLVVVHRLLIAVFSVVAEHGL